MGSAFVSDLWHALSAEHIPDGLDRGLHSSHPTLPPPLSLSLSFYLLLFLPFVGSSTSVPPFLFPSLEARLKRLGRLALKRNAGVTLRSSLMENLALFHCFSASRRASPSSPSSPPPSSPGLEIREALAWPWHSLLSH